MDGDLSLACPQEKLSTEDAEAEVAMTGANEGPEDAPAVVQVYLAWIFVCCFTFVAFLM